jgi:hypothetical protein
MLELPEAQVTNLKWGDANFFGYYWDSQFTEPTLIIRIAPANSPTQELVCNWATKLKLNLDYKDHVNPLLTWEVSFKSLPNQRWKVFFDFCDHGSIEFESNRLAIRELPSTITT